MFTIHATISLHAVPKIIQIRTTPILRKILSMKGIGFVWFGFMAYQP